MGRDERPDLSKDRFKCPHCELVGDQKQTDLYCITDGAPVNLIGFVATRCACCGLHAIWYDGMMKWPTRLIAPPPCSSLPDALKREYQEARRVLPHSLRACWFLLRQLMHHMCAANGQPDEEVPRAIRLLLVSRQVKSKSISTQLEELWSFDPSPPSDGADPPATSDPAHGKLMAFFELINDLARAIYR